MAYYLSEINARCRADAAGFIAECDRVYADRLELAADRIMENMEKSPIVLLSGPSGSGKTTTRRRRRARPKGSTISNRPCAWIWSF